ncbi:hypothetical protein PAPYR_11526 [Paratrimastix pyriformis]|uniref:Uncharacterized protein n=1 Tax=Paratrimastix pyriformis TaxID=342808 RepID=A0ABQ8U7C6_9EUKA|nr:hypothetical protein PAPYR_11526 [Paratrimastix pyriformis]
MPEVRNSPPLVSHTPVVRAARGASCPRCVMLAVRHARGAPCPRCAIAQKDESTAGTDMTCQILLIKFLDVSAVLRACCASVHSFLVWDTSGEMQYCGCSFVFDFFERLLVFTGASLQRCMREILIARAPMRRLFEVFDWFTTKTTRSGVAQSFTLSTKRFVLCELDTVILVRSFKAVPLLSPNSPFFFGKHAGPLFFGGLFCKVWVLGLAHSGMLSA